MKSVSVTNLAITENTECTIITPVIDIKVGVSPKHGVSLRFTLLPAFQTFG